MRTTQAIVGLHLLTAIVLASGCSPTSTQPVSTQSGAVQGVVEQGVNLFRGIPYAAPPIGDLRWRAPEPAAAWDGVRQADAYGPACWQATDAGESIFLQRLLEGAGVNTVMRWLMQTAFAWFPMTVSEDCLTLNVLAPVEAQDMPVMVWIHGGGHQFGSGGMTYESKSLVQQGIVLVTLNYRLGLYGFFAHPELAAEDPHGSTGNYGMLDQLAALQWVQTNIAAFGGDPDNVTVFGESAGGHSVGQLMASPLAHGLFHRAIAQSGTGLYQFQSVDAAHERMSGLDAGLQAAASLGLGSTDAIRSLRALSTDQLKNIAMDPLLSATYHPQIDGYVLPKSTAQVFREGGQMPIPLITGSNADEGSVLYHLGLPPLDGGPPQQPTVLTEWRALLTAALGATAAASADDLYGVRTDADVVDAAEALMGDSWFGRHAFYMMRFHAAAGHPSYLYFYKRRSPADSQTIGASHAMEINHVFGGFIPNWPSDARDEALTSQMQRYWTAFAADGTPAPAGLPAWPVFDTANPVEMRFGHTDTQPQPVERIARYRLLWPQFEARILRATEVEPTATPTDEAALIQATPVEATPSQPS